MPLCIAPGRSQRPFHTDSRNSRVIHPGSRHAIPSRVAPPTTVRRNNERSTVRGIGTAAEALGDRSCVSPSAARPCPQHGEAEQHCRPSRRLGHGAAKSRASTLHQDNDAGVAQGRGAGELAELCYSEIRFCGVERDIRIRSSLKVAALAFAATERMTMTVAMIRWRFCMLSLSRRAGTLIVAGLTRLVQDARATDDDGACVSAGRSAGWRGTETRAAPLARVWTAMAMARRKRAQSASSRGERPAVTS